MKKFVVAGMLGLATLVGTERDAFALNLFGLHLGERDRSEQVPPAPLSGQPEQTQRPIMVQSGDAEIRLQQAEDQMRQLNGRIEEMSYQLLQMQETIRKAQADNELRFQMLEKKSGGAVPAPAGTIKKSEADTSAAGQSDDIAKVIETPQGADANRAASSGLGQPPSQLGSIQFDQNGQPIGGAVNSNDVGSGPAPSAGANTASLGNEGDTYKAAYGHVLSGDYAVAEKEFRQYLGSYPESARSADANFWLGEALYSQGKYNDAATTFVNAYKKYGTSEKAPEMLLKLGMSLAALDNKDTACATLHEVTKKYPKASKPVVTKVASEEKRLAC
ncbi:tol-pal system protein YbgF [Rhizobium sp. HT1-10]|uniref:tol-pal system protein YbgF n=1 Tax=Rhizobium sp. HT1-10 TaxID=3111638 RepID=UPI003C2A151F